MDYDPAARVCRLIQTSGLRKIPPTKESAKAEGMEIHLGL